MTDPVVARARCAHLATDAQGVVLSVEPSFTALLGWPPDEIVGKRVGTLVHRDDLPRGLAAWKRLLDGGEEVGAGLRLRYRHRDGRWIWLDVANHSRLDDPDHADVASELTDASSEMAALEALAVRDQLLDQVAEMSSVGVFHADRDGRLLHVNQKLVEMTGAAGASTLGEQLVGLADRDRPRLRAAVQGATGGAETGVEVEVGVVGGGAVGGGAVGGGAVGGAAVGGGVPDRGVERRRWSVSLRPVRGADGAVTGIAGCVQDTTEMAGHPGDRSRASTDALTGCLTKEATVAALDELIRRHELRTAGGAGAGARSGAGGDAGPVAGAGVDTEGDAGTTSASPPAGGTGRRGGGGHRGVAVLVIQVEGLDALNEHRGPTAGDELLALMALRIVDSVRASDVVGRVGGDEFAILCGGVPGPTTALTIGRSTLEQVSQPMELRTSGTFAVRASMGVSWTDQVAPAEALLDRARAAAVSSKLDGATQPVLAGAGTSPR